LQGGQYIIIWEGCGRQLYPKNLLYYFYMAGGAEENYCNCSLVFLYCYCYYFCILLFLFASSL